MDSPKKKRYKPIGERQLCGLPGCGNLVQIPYDKCHHHTYGYVCSVGECRNFAFPPTWKCRAHRGLCLEKGCHRKAKCPVGKCKKHTIDVKCLEEGCENVGIYSKWCPDHSIRCLRCNVNYDRDPSESETPICMACYDLFDRVRNPNINVTPLKE